jgi:hypothetical protein
VQSCPSARPAPWRIVRRPKGLTREATEVRGVRLWQVCRFFRKTVARVSQLEARAGRRPAGSHCRESCAVRGDGGWTSEKRAAYASAHAMLSLLTSLPTETLGETE